MSDINPERKYFTDTEILNYLLDWMRRNQSEPFVYGHRLGSQLIKVGRMREGINLELWKEHQKIMKEVEEAQQREDIANFVKFPHSIQLCEYCGGFERHKPKCPRLKELMASKDGK
ncbi:MAG: hypothetical protein KG003_08055 [Bacteroidetes bacterium]|nr:hypothetical protein [Bacteroidota bacterium]